MVRHNRFLLEQAGIASGLLNEGQLDEAWRRLVESSPATDLSLEEITDTQLASSLIELGHLNPWQAEQLRQGRTKFTLGPYKVLDAIGHGGMGYVFKGEHALMGRVEAIKVLPKSKKDQASIDSFCREIRALAKLDHPNLVRLSYADREGNTYYLVTEFIDGADLRRIVRHSGPLGAAETALIISQAASALSHAHHRGLVHRDVKPGNLLITREGRAKLTDLGLAEFCTDEPTPPGEKPIHIVGTADFLAPEIVVSPDKIQPISDIYSLGCTLYYALTGKVPFPGGSTSQKLRRHLDEEPIPVKRLRGDLEPGLIDLIHEMMAKRPESRIPDAETVIDRLKPWTDRVGPDTYYHLGELAGLPEELSFTNAPLAETVELEDNGSETTRRRGERTDRVRPTHPKPQETEPAPRVIGIGIALLIIVAIFTAVAACVAVLRG